MSEIVDLLSELSDLDSAPKTPDVEPVVARPEPVATGYEPRTQFGRYVDHRQKTRAAREASMSDVDKEMRANRIAQVANIFASPVVKGLTSVISRGRVVPNMDMRNEAATQKQLADRMSALENKKAAAARAADYSAAAEGLELPEGYESMQPVVRAMAKNDPEQFVGLVTSLARANRPRRDHVLDAPLTEDEIELASQYELGDIQDPRLVRNTIAAINKTLYTRRPETATEDPTKALRVEALRLANEQKRRDLSSAPESGAGRPMQTSQAEALSDIKASMSQVQNMVTGLENPNTPTGPMAYLRGMNMFDVEALGAKQLVAATKQLVGKALEGGVLRKEDEEKYAKILPREFDTLPVIRKKTEQLVQMLYSVYKGKVSAYKAAGYDVSGFVPKQRDYSTMAEAEADLPNLDLGTEIYINGKFIGVAE